ncbi:MAG: ParB N-terminal domain-containing protein [Gammaproteobacteria bacterium]|nr:ParB N-terminal domain-containing protein [Gammaproteobacteria bacterium]
MNGPDTPDAANTVSRVDVTRIRHYPRNPRRQRNPEYDRIKASIQAEGLDQPLVLSQEPGASDYVLHSGGNTRLRILQELFAETGDERFRRVDCIIRPWSQESNVLFAHLRENELRGGLPFIDKALAVFDAKALLEQELCAGTLSQRQLEALFSERGFGLSHSMISKMGYAVDTLWPVMPKALAAGLGRPQVEKIRALERASSAIWRRRQLGDDADFDGVFAELCRRHDGSEWDIQPLRDALENEIAIESEQNHQVIHLEMEAQLSGRPFEFSSHIVEEAEEAGEVQRQEGSSVSVGQPDDGHATDTAAPKNLATERESRSIDSLGTDDLETDDFERQFETITPAPEYHQDISILELGSKTTRNPKDLNSLRAQLWGCAYALAVHHGLSETVIQLPNKGLGLLLIDVPPQELTETLDPDALSLVSALWWHFAASSELTVAPVEILLSYIDEASTLHQALASHDAGLLFNRVWTPDPGHLNSQLWQQLNPPDWKHLLLMMESYRTIKRLAFDTGVDLWATGEGEDNGVQ